MEEKEMRVRYWEALDSIVYRLLNAKENGEHVYCNYKGHVFHSDTVTMDSAFQEVYGCSYEEHKRQNYILMNETSLEREKRLRAAQPKIDECIPYWIERGRAIIFPERYEAWENIVHELATPGGAGKLQVALEVMEAIENGISLEEAGDMIRNSLAVKVPGDAFKIVDIVYEFSKKGPEFKLAFYANALYRAGSLEKIEAKRQENLQLAEIYAQTSGSGARS